MDTPVTNAAKIVEELLDNDAAKEYALGLNIDTSGATPEQLQTFKRQVIGYVNWVSQEDVAEAVQWATTFKEVLDILVPHDQPETPEISFLSMVSQGYF